MQFEEALDIALIPFNNKNAIDAKIEEIIRNSGMICEALKSLAGRFGKEIYHKITRDAAIIVWIYGNATEQDYLKALNTAMLLEVLGGDYD